jgi:hypothetical protein
MRVSGRGKGEVSSLHSVATWGAFFGVGFLVVL